MRKFLLVVGIASIGFIGKAGAQPRRTGDFTSMPVFEDNGDSIRAFAINIASFSATTPAVLVYSSQTTKVPRTSNYVSVDRFLTIQNQTGFDVYCGTFSTVNPTSGPRWVIYSTVTAATAPFSVWGTNTPPANIYCTMNSAVPQAGLPLIGWIDYDSGD